VLNAERLPLATLREQLPFGFRPRRGRWQPPRWTTGSAKSRQAANGIADRPRIWPLVGGKANSAFLYSSQAA